MSKINFTETFLILSVTEMIDTKRNCGKVRYQLVPNSQVHFFPNATVILELVGSVNFPSVLVVCKTQKYPHDTRRRII